MRRVLCVWLPTFSTDLVKRRRARRISAEPGDRRPRAEEAVILTRAVASREVVSRRCAVAAAVCVGEGMDVAHARSLFPARVPVHIEEHRADRDAAALHALACWAIRFSPLVATDSPDALLIDITGTERLFRSEGRLIRAVASGVHRLGFAVRIASASTFGCAWGVARFGKHDFSRVRPGCERNAIIDLPVAALRVDGPAVRSLGEIGITTVGHLLDLPRASLAARFDGGLLRRLHQTVGEIDEHIDPVRLVPPTTSELIFDGQTDRWESVEAATRQVLGELVVELVRRERGVRRLDVRLLRPHAAALDVQINLSRPSCVVKHLWSLVRSRLERVDLGDGIEGIVMTASRTARLRHEQRGSPSLGAEEERGSEAAWGELVDTLAVRLGVDDVVRIEPVESHLPERAFREMPAMEASPRGKSAAVTHADRPTVLYPHPEAADATVLTPDGPVLSLGWRGRRWNVVSCIGPERIGQEWWRWEPGTRAEEEAGNAIRSGPRAHHRTRELPPPDRDYFAVQTDGGRWLWAFRHVGTSRWFVHGEWS